MIYHTHVLYTTWFTILYTTWFTLFYTTETDNYTEQILIDKIIILTGATNAPEVQSVPQPSENNNARPNTAIQASSDAQEPQEPASIPEPAPTVNHEARGAPSVERSANQRSGDVAIGNIYMSLIISSLLSAYTLSVQKFPLHI